MADQETKEVAVGATPTTSSGVDYQPAPDEGERTEGTPDPKLTPGHAKYDEYAHMVAIIAAGGSVLYKGRVLSRVQDLPTAAALAKGDAVREKATADALDAQIAALQAQRSTLGSVGASGTGGASAKKDDGK
jgi:hypothetical protein